MYRHRSAAPFGRINRRGFLVTAGAATTFALASRSLLASGRFKRDPFTLGVASGDPQPDSVVLWTRLAPAPLEGGGMPPLPVPVRWKVATDERMRRVVARGVELAVPELAHTVRVDVQGLQPGRWYYYQFQVANAESRIGRTRTAPARGARTERLRFAVASCQDFQNGFYSAYRNMADEELDLVVFLGDYIYEYGPQSGGPRQHLGPETVTLEQYRQRYAQYRLDPDLQEVHARFPFIVTPDDHEVENNYANLTPEETSEQFGDPATFLVRRANAYQAYYEHMPLRATSYPNGADIQLYRRFTFGDLLELNVLDTRQYRTDQPCGDGLKPLCAEALAASATMTGTAQEQWLFEGLAHSHAIWNVLGQQTILGRMDFDPRPSPVDVFNVDQWDGYVAARARLITFLQQVRQQRSINPVVLTGDIHSSWVFDIKADFANPASATLATEFVGTSISSDFPASFIAPVQAALPANPHCKFFDGLYRGYIRCDVGREEWRSDFRRVASILDANAPVSTLKSFVVEAERPGAQAV